ncbi:unnamed protein product [Agarophyton chilense]
MLLLQAIERTFLLLQIQTKASALKGEEAPERISVDGSKLRCETANTEKQEDIEDADDVELLSVPTERSPTSLRPQVVTQVFDPTDSDFTTSILETQDKETDIHGNEIDEEEEEVVNVMDGDVLFVNVYSVPAEKKLPSYVSSPQTHFLKPEMNPGFEEGRQVLR